MDTATLDAPTQDLDLTPCTMDDNAPICPLTRGASCPSDPNRVKLCPAC
jgi:hypothetical protein